MFGSGLSRFGFVALFLLHGFSIGIATADEKKSDPDQAAAIDPRSSAALNRDAAWRALKAGKVHPSGQILPRRIHHSTVNNPAADTTAQDTQSETTVANLGAGNIIAAFNDSGSFGTCTAPGNVTGCHFTGYAFSSNAGFSWSDPGTLPDSPEGDAGDPVLSFHRGSNSLYLSTLGFVTGENIQVFKSVDLGHTFGAPVNGTPGYAGTGDFQDKEWITVDNFAGSGNGNVYLCWTRFLSGGGAEIRFTRSIDGAATFAPNLGTLISTGGQGCFVTVSPSHQLSLFYYRGTGASGQGGDNKLFMRRSLDQGLTFQAEVQVADLATTTTNGNLTLNGGVRSNSFPHAAVNPRAPVPFLYAIYNDLTAPGDADIFLTHSTDGGLTWSAPTRVNDDTAGDQFFPTIGITSSGNRVAISYYSRSQDPANLVFHRRVRTGVILGDGSVRFNQSFQVSPNTPIVIGQDPVINPTYMGDYDQIDGNRNEFSVSWSDTRQGNSFHANQPDVRFARVPANPAVVDLGVSATTTPGSVGLGGNKVFTVTASALFRNLTDVFLSVPLVPGLAIMSANASGGQCDVVQQFIGCSLGSIALGTSKSVQIVATAARRGRRVLKAIGTTSGRELNLANNAKSVVVNVTQGNAVAARYSTGDIAVAIPDNGTVEIPITVLDQGTVVEVKPLLRLNHTFDADLDIHLIAPNGATVELSTDNGGSGDNYGAGSNDCAQTKTVFSDTASTSITAGTAPFAGSFKPEQPLQNLVGTPTDGVWRLRITDDAGGDVGIVGCVQLQITRLP